MTTPAFVEAFRTHEFVVEIENIPSPGITKVTGLTEGEVDAIDQADGGSPFVHKIPSTMIKYGDLTLERHMDGTDTDTQFKQWWQTMFLIDGTGTAATIRKNGSVIKKHFGQEVLRFAFEGAWIKSSKFADFDAKTDTLLTQTIVLAIERMYRV
jgi:phage tail-like protein